ncbi:tetrahydrofolate dehydrogenase/cyclohydrolase, NAD(P)-binding domain protein [Clostridiales bacterium KA00134]|nr:tetrahydrofolate dehydrogenase/cyclohydrolase, NAD(P)-binding domain protein [Clostridiales bacterium KA00134]
MSKILSGKEVRSFLKTKLEKEIKNLNNPPELGLIRLGQNPQDLSYERALEKTAKELGIKVESKNLAQDADPSDLKDAIKAYNQNEKIGGVLIFRPLPSHIKEDEIKDFLDPKKDLDAMTSKNLARAFTGDESGHFPITAQAAVMILDYYGYELEGKKALVINRSSVVGRPLCSLLLNKNATVTLAHSKTADLKAEIRQADFVFLATGRAEKFTKDYFTDKQVVIDISINFNAEGKICGDLHPSAFDRVAAYSPVPGGVGSLTNLLLFKELLKNKR